MVHDLVERHHRVRSSGYVGFRESLAGIGKKARSEEHQSNDKWTRAQSLVDGRLLKQEVTAVLDGLKKRDPLAVYAAAQFQVASEGPVHLKLIGADGSLTWVDGKPLEFGSETAADLPAGKHTIVLKLDSRKLPEAIRLESADATFLAN